MPERQRRCRAAIGRFVPFVVIGAIIAGSVSCSGHVTAGQSHRPESELVVSIADGRLRGSQAGGMDDYLGIPYAAPPVGPLRWRAPQPPARWTGIRAATRFAAHCAQPAGVFGRASMSENCLYLNVFTPARQHRSGLPVMLWIHGGGF